MNNFKLKTLVLGLVQTNCYIISNVETREAIVFDPADNADKIEQYLKANDLVCKGILLTHGHFDHILAVPELSAAVHAPVYAHEEEAELLKDVHLNASVEFRRDCQVTADVLLKDREQLELAGFHIRVLHTPGHTQGSTCYYFSRLGILLSGDTLFFESVGRSDFPTGNGILLVESILNQLMILEDHIAVYPGHGRPTTIGYERDNNIYIQHNPDVFDI